MIDRAQVLIFTPTYNNGLRHETVASVVGQHTRHWITYEIGRCNPYPGRDMRNVLAQYAYAREMCLRGPYDALLTVEHDVLIPPGAVQMLCDTPAPVVYGTYMLRHGEPVLNAWQYIGTAGLGMSLQRYPLELQQYREAGVGRVSGVGFGCTLIRRNVLETVPFRQDGSDHAPDMPFALDCVRKEILQLARFDVRCGHIDRGKILETSKSSSEGMVKVTCIQPVNIMVNGDSVSLAEGDEVELPKAQAEELAALGYVTVGGTKSVPGETTTRIGDQGDEQAALPGAPRVPRKPV